MSIDWGWELMCVLTWCPEHIRCLLALLPLGSSVLEPNLEKNWGYQSLLEMCDLITK